jgi:hypothetical protein
MNALPPFLAKHLDHVHAREQSGSENSAAVPMTLRTLQGSGATAVNGTNYSFANSGHIQTHTE